MARYSHSRMEAFRQCPLKYRFAYIDRIEKEEEGIEAFTGSRVHDALEELLRLEKEFDREPDQETAEELFLKFWDEKYHEGVQIVRENVTAEDYKRRGLMCIRNYFEMEAGLDHGELLDLEKNIIFQIDGKTISGKIDRLHRKGNIYHIIDYKTSSSDMTQEQADLDTQLALYELGIRRLFPDVEEVVLHWYMLPHRHVVSSMRSADELQALERQVSALIEQMESTTDFRPTGSALCVWCEYQEECEKEKRQRSIRASQTEPPMEDLVEEYARLADDRSHLRSEVRELEEKMGNMELRFAEVARETGAWSIEGSEHVLDVDLSTGLYIPAKGTEERELLEEIVCKAGAWDEMSEISKACVLKALESGRFGELGPQIKAKFEEREKVKINIRNIKPI